VLQEKFYGKLSEPGTGMVPGDLISYRTTKQGIAEAIDTIYVKHASGGLSSVQFKSYQEGRESFQGSAIDVGFCDEEPSASVFTEILMRTMTTDGICYITFTPLQGLSEVVLSFLPNGLPGA
jgi:phage terminase large subunit-like protein